MLAKRKEKVSSWNEERREEEVKYVPVHWQIFILFYQLKVKKIAGYQTDIRYPAFRISGYPAGWISGKISIRCIPRLYYQFLKKKLKRILKKNFL